VERVFLGRRLLGLPLTLSPPTATHMLTADLEAIVHRGAKASVVAAHAEFDAAGHVFGLRHLRSFQLLLGTGPHAQPSKATRLVPGLCRIVSSSAPRLSVFLEVL
jgi:hypothetical protein